MSNNNNNTNTNPLAKLRIDHNPLLVAGRCQEGGKAHPCTRKPTHILYFLVGEHLNIRSIYGCLCETHAEQKKIEFIDRYNRETIIEKIEDINASRI